MTERTGILGGTFNPIHLGHIRLGLEIKEYFNLNRILYILSAKPPHKTDQNIVPQELRWQMLTRGLKKHPGLIPSDIEIKRSDYSWTIDTIQELQRENPGHRFYFINGSECFLNIKTWKNYKTLLRSVSFVIVLRKPEHKKEVTGLLEEEDLKPMEFSGDGSSPGIYIFNSNSEILTISSTLIRDSLKNNRPVEGFLEPEVLKIIKEHNLYES